MARSWDKRSPITQIYGFVWTAAGEEKEGSSADPEPEGDGMDTEADLEQAATAAATESVAAAVADTAAPSAADIDTPMESGGMLLSTSW